ncbi:DUF6702 family protein [Chitinophagaceae bacterium LWZ2-11]
MANIIFQWLVTGIVALMHPFYVSVIDINQNAKDKTLEVSVRIFTEDFENTLQKATSVKVDLVKPADKAFLDKLINNYIQTRLQLKVDGKPIKLNYLGQEQQQESTWCYFEAPGVTSVKKIDVNCNVLYDFENKQINIIHAKVGGNEKSYKLDYPNTTTSFDF